MEYDEEISIRYESGTMEDANAYFDAVAEGDYDKMVSLLDQGKANVNRFGRFFGADDCCVGMSGEDRGGIDQERLQREQRYADQEQHVLAVCGKGECFPCPSWSREET